MKKQVKVTLHAKADKYSDNGLAFSVFDHQDMSSYGYVACDTVEVEFDLPPGDVLVNGLVAAYRAEQTRIRAEAQAKITAIEETIQKMLCLEHKPEAQ